MRFFKILSIVSVFILNISFVWAQSNISVSQERPIAAAVALDTDPIIDGNILKDEVWQNLTPITEMWQTRPNAGQPASELTEIRIAYSTTTFYVAVVCHDKEPDKLVVSDARRDANLEGTDSFIFILDTYHDGLNGFVFGTNSIGIEYDAQVDNEGQGNFNSNRQQGGMIGGFNLNWDASWTVQTEVDDYGWSAEFAIPLKTIRFKAGENQTWGLNMRRNIRKTQEIVYWAQLPIQFTLNRLSLAGDLTGLSLQNPGNLKLIPYALGRVVKLYQDPEATEADLSGDIGVDLKYSITPSVTLDLTYNTDFAQVEVDDQQVNLDRFNLFFPEKRPFFLENAGQFGVGSPGEVDLFFSRRIGIGEGGQVVPILGGTRVSGKINRTNIGFLSMFTDQVGEGTNKENNTQNNFTVARVNHEFSQKRSAIGAAFISRTGIAGIENDYNQTFAVDGKLGLGKKAQLTGFYAQSNTPEIGSGQHALQFKSGYEWNGLILSGGYTEVGQGFNPEVGFLLRESFRKPEFLILQRIRPEKGWLGVLEMRPHISYRSYWNFDGSLQTSFLHVDNHWEWQSGFEVHTGINFTIEGVQKDFEIFEGVNVPAGRYPHREAQFVLLTNPSRPISFSTRHILGGFFGGKRYANSVTMRVLLGDKFNSEFQFSRNDIDLPGGKFNTNIFRGRLSYSFTPLIFVQSLIQYNSAFDIWSANARFGWLQRANTGLFVVYNQLTDEFGINNRSFTIKYSHMIDVLR